MGSGSDRTIDEIECALASASGARLERLISELADDSRTGVARAISRARSRENARSRESRRLTGLYRLERELREAGYQTIAGVDEVGRGALAGPLSAGACVLPPTPRIAGLDDSKRLTPARREELAAEIKSVALCWSVGHVGPDEIDAIGMSAALRTAMGRALQGLTLPPDHVVVDGLRVGVFPVETAVVKGDSKVASIAAASILAKVERDALMVEMSTRFPDYGLHINKGYGTPEHIAAISRSGLSSIHRVSFSFGGGTASLF
jgi:ribonuclease HII